MKHFLALGACLILGSFSSGMDTLVHPEARSTESTPAVDPWLGSLPKELKKIIIKELLKIYRTNQSPIDNSTDLTRCSLSTEWSSLVLEELINLYDDAGVECPVPILTLSAACSKSLNLLLILKTELQNRPDPKNLKALEEISPAFIAAAQFGSPAAMKLLDQKYPGTVAEFTDAEGINLLMHAAQAGNTEMIPCILSLAKAPIIQANNSEKQVLKKTRSAEELATQTELETAPYIDRVDANGRTALLIAIQEGHLKTARALLENGASPELPEQNYISPPLHVAMYHLRADLVDLLIVFKANASKVYGNTTALQIVKTGALVKNFLATLGLAPEDPKYRKEYEGAFQNAKHIEETLLYLDPNADIFGMSFVPTKAKHRPQSPSIV